MRQTADFSLCKQEEIKQCRHHHELRKHQIFIQRCRDNYKISVERICTYMNKKSLININPQRENTQKIPSK
jgi:hypothetical protein